jgi:hypothetical protein
MTTLSISPPFPIFSDRDGSPLENGYVWIGTANLNPITNPIAVFWDAAQTQPAAQPVRTINGYPSNNGTPGRLYVNSDFSITVQDSKGSLVYSAPAATDRVNDVIISGLPPISSNDVTFLQAGTGAVTRSVQDKDRDVVSAFDFMSAAEIADVKAGTKTLTVTTALQAAADYAYKNGKILLIPAGTYKAKLVLPPTGTTEPRGDAFVMQGEGAGIVYLGGVPFVKGTTLVSPDTAPALNLLNVLGAADTGPILHIRDIRFEGNSTNPVVQFATWSDFCEMSNCEIRQDGTGGGINMIRAFGGTIKETHVVNGNLIGTGSYTGTGINAQTPYAGGLLTFFKVSVRGFNTGFSLGSGGVTYNLSTTLQQCECAWNNYGIINQAGMRKTVINECYFEAVQIVGVQDEGEGTTISNCFMFEGPATQIKGDYDTRGNTYFGNYIQLAGPTQTGIAIKGSADATGYAKTVRDNFIYFLNSGGAVANVYGVYVTGSNPAINFDSNVFRPRRAWVGGAGTTKFAFAGTGQITGMVPQTDTLNEFPLASNYSISFPAYNSSLTQADVAAGVLALPASSSRIALSASGAVNVTSIGLTGQSSRMVIFEFANTNMTFVKGATMLMASNFSGPGQLLCDLRIIGGTMYLYELGRTVV